MLIFWNKRFLCKGKMFPDCTEKTESSEILWNTILSGKHLLPWNIKGERCAHQLSYKSTSNAVTLLSYTETWAYAQKHIKLVHTETLAMLLRKHRQRSSASLERSQNIKINSSLNFPIVLK